MKFEKEVKLKNLCWGKNYACFKCVIENANVFDINKLLILFQENKKNLKLTLEVEEPILDDEERKYLSGVIRPFRDKVVGIYKYNSVLSDYEEIAVDTCADYNCNHMTHLPPFKKSTMYKNMELNKEYSLEDLGL